MTRTAPRILILCAGLALAGCATQQSLNPPETFTGPGGAGGDCTWSNPATVAPGTPCPPGR